MLQPALLVEDGSQLEGGVLLLAEISHGPEIKIPYHDLDEGVLRGVAAKEVIQEITAFRGSNVHVLSGCHIFRGRLPNVYFS